MLNFQLNVDAKLRNVHYPIYFQGKNVCVHCGRSGGLHFIDAFGKKTNKELYPFERIKCDYCKREYSIKWDTDEFGNMVPSAVDPGVKQDFYNIVHAKDVAKVPRIAMDN